MNNRLAAMEGEMRFLRDASKVPRYLFFSPWPVKTGSGVNNVILGLGESIKTDYCPVIVVTGWTEPPADQQWMKLPSPTFGVRSFAGALLHLAPNLRHLRRALAGAVAANPHFFGTEVFPLALLRKFSLAPSLILSVHGADVSSIRSGSWFERQLYSWICRTADVVVACSHALAAEVLELSPTANVVAVWNGISNPPLTIDARPIRAPYLVSVAAFVKKKGHDTLLRAFREIAADFQEHRLVLIGGDGPERATIEQLVQELDLVNRVDILLNVPHDAVWKWVGHADCFVHAAREEPFGLAVLEAALVKTPVVVTDVGGVAEYLRNGVDGLSAPPDSPDEFARLISHVLTHRMEAEQRADIFFEKAVGFTWDAAWARYKQAAKLPLPAQSQP